MTILLTIAFLSGPLRNPATSTDTVYLPPNLCLVRATVVDTWREPGAIHETGKLRVTSVVAGPGLLKGREFFCLVGSLHPFASGTIPQPLEGVIPHIQKGPEGLWWVYVDPDFLTLKPELRWEKRRSYRLSHFPILNTSNPMLEGVGGLLGARSLDPLDPRFYRIEGRRRVESLVELRQKDAATWSEAAGEVYRAKTDAERRAILMLYASAPESPVSGWAITLLGRGPKKSTVKFLRGLSDKATLLPDGQFTLDKVLCKIDSKHWLNDPARREMFLRWLDPKANMFELIAGCLRAGEAARAGELGVAMLAEALGPALSENNNLTDLHLFHVGELLALTSFAGPEQGKWMEFLQTVSKIAKHRRLRTEAERGLRSLSRP